MDGLPARGSLCQAASRNLSQGVLYIMLRRSSHPIRRTSYQTPFEFLGSSQDSSRMSTTPPANKKTVDPLHVVTKIAPFQC